MRLLVLLFIATFAACANPPITQVSEDIYQIHRSDGAGVFGDPVEFGRKVRQEAQDFADSQGKILVPVSVHEVPLKPGRLYKVDFRFRLVDPPPSLARAENQEQPIPATESEAINYYFDGRNLESVEGIWTWDDNQYQIALIRDKSGVAKEYDFIGVVIRSSNATWKPGGIKLMLNSTASPILFTGVYFDGLKVPHDLSYFMEDANLIRVNETFEDGQPLLIRDYPAGLIKDGTIAGRAVSTGTCFIVDPVGTAVTSHHVIDGASTIVVTLADGRELAATVELSSLANDVAILNVSAATPNYLSFASTRATASGEQVFTVGFPTVKLLGSEAKFTEGSVSALSGIRGEAAYMQISVPVQPGNSGGPVVNFDGEVLGIVAATAAVESFYNVTGSLPQNVNWAVKSDFVQPMIGETPVLPRAPDRDSAISRVQKAVCRVSASR